MKTLRLEGGMNYLKTTEGFKDLQKHENDHRGPGDERIKQDPGNVLLMWS